MKNRMLNGPFSHDLMMTVLKELYPELAPGADYMAGHMIDPDSGEQDGAPFFLHWKAKGIEQPDAADIKAAFLANEARYRSIFARRYRDACLEWSDAKAVIPDDAPAAIRAKADIWRAYRQALRDVPQQPGFPIDIDWPEYPGA